MSAERMFRKLYMPTMFCLANDTGSSSEPDLPCGNDDSPCCDSEPDADKGHKYCCCKAMATGNTGEGCKCCCDKVDTVWGKGECGCKSQGHKCKRTDCGHRYPAG